MKDRRAEGQNDRRTEGQKSRRIEGQDVQINRMKRQRDKKPKSAGGITKVHKDDRIHGREE